MIAADTVPDRTEILAELREIGRVPEPAIDLAGSALLLAALDRPGEPLGPYRAHLDEIGRDVRRAVTDADTLEARVSALNAAIFAYHGYEGDTIDYDDLKNANLMQVIDRKRGLPIAISILYIHAARSLGWAAGGVNFPGHFLVRLELDGEQAIVDAFDRGTVCDAARLRQILKSVMGEGAELDPGHYAPAGDRAVLLRLQNNIKMRLLESEDYARAAEVIDAMMLLAPNEPSLLREHGMVQARTGNVLTAIESLERYIGLGPPATQQHEAAALLQKLKTRLN